MKTNVQKILVVSWLLIPSLYSSPASAEPLAYHGNCATSCFKTEILNVESSEEGCMTYQLKVFTTKGCAHELSHYTVEVPTCFDITQVSNTKHWPQEIGSTDPTTGLYGFKIDDIKNFGKCGDDEYFIVNFTVCSDESCETPLSCWAPKVAYKAATCVYYEETEVSCVSLAAHLEKQDATCNNATDGSISVVIDEGNEPFSYAWSTGDTTQILDNIGAGTYSVTISDADGNTLVLDTLINAPEAIVITGEIMNASCNGSINGSIDLSVSGGAAGYTYSWSNGAQTEDIDSLASGSYIINITDENGCTASERFTVSNHVNITIGATVTKASCSNENGAIDMTVTGGVAPYTYAWNNGADTEDLEALAPGLYKVTITDANGCSADGSFLVQENNPLLITATTTKTGCVEDNTGSVDITVQGGEAPYTYAWSNGESAEDIENLAAGLYTVTVTDQNGCSTSMNVVISSQSFSVSPSITPVSCAGGSDGSITLVVSGGVEPYTYSWSNGATAASIDDLPGTLYSVTITDASGCTKTLSYVVAQPPAISASASVTNPSCGSGDYNIDINVSGGSGDYSFEWSNGADTQNLDSLDEGEYMVTITDSRGCTITLTAVADPTSVGCDDGTGGGDDGDGGDGTGDGGDDGSGDGGDDGGSGGDGHGGGHNGQSCVNPYSSDIALVSIDEGCYTYKLTVNYNGEHVHGLSHMSIEQLCGDLSDVDIDYHNWPVEEGTDPTTGIDGFKIDNISGFGEGDFPDSFEANFTICTTDEACEESLGEADFKVAYKYGQCVAYEDVDGDNITSDPDVYPNPCHTHATIEFRCHKKTDAVVEVYNQCGIKVRTLYRGELKAHTLHQFIFDAKNLPNDIYTYRISTREHVYHGRIIKH